MAVARRAGWDWLAVSAVLITVMMSVWYVTLIAREGGRPVAWFLGGLAGCAVLMVYGASRAAPRRGIALAIAGVVLAALGYLALLSIGFPILVAGILALVAAIKARR
ncbi:hypothetical protein [Acrocarpospora macrocephala]|uniref:hypothetical protein n=2 Tax=Acrocarpospora macrocephala TaxID=150177 RepID=UPI0031D320EE